MAVTKVVRVYTGADQRSHFADLEVPMHEFRLGTLYSFKSLMPQPVLH